MTEFFSVAGRQRACRSFLPTPVPDELVAKVLEAATFAPSAENRQPWAFVVVRDEERRRAVGGLMARAWEAGGKAHSEGRLPGPMLRDVDRGASGGVAAAPVLVVVGGDTSLVVERVVPSSVFPAVQNMLLAATALGLGSALTTLATAYATELAELVGFPPEVRPLAVVPLGWPARQLGPPRRLPLGQRAHREHFGTSW